MAISDYTIGRPYMAGSGVCRKWERLDLYRPSGNYDRVFLASGNDLSPMFAHWQHERNGARYNSGCSCCYLGIGHSEQCHIERLARHVSGKIWEPFAGLVSVDVRPVEYGGYSEEYPVFPMWELWLVGEGSQAMYGVWDNEAGALSAAVVLRGKVSK